MNRVVDSFRAKFLRADVYNGVRVGFTHPEDTDIHFHQLFGFDHANPQNTLQEEIGSLATDCQ